MSLGFAMRRSNLKYPTPPLLNRTRGFFFLTFLFFYKKRFFGEKKIKIRKEKKTLHWTRGS